MKKIISFSLWGDNPKYCIGAIKNAKMRKEIYPDWICRFYIHKDVPIEYVEKLCSIEGTEVVIKNSDADWTFTTERFKAIDDDDVERVIFRDTDSRLTLREKKAVDEWINQKTTLHVMKDHPHHGSFPILAGMWGIYKNKDLGSMHDCLIEYKKMNPQIFYYYDQIFLSMLWNNLKHDSTIHDEFFLKKPFPSQRIENEFVGQSFDEHDNTPKEHIEALRSIENEY